MDENIHNVHDVVKGGGWNADRLLEVLPEKFALHIVQKIRPLVMDNVLDTPYWMLETRGHFSVKSAWEYLRRREDPRSACRMIWVKGLPFKIAFFMCKVWKAKLPLDDFMRRLGYFMPYRCWCCAEPKGGNTSSLVLHINNCYYSVEVFYSKSRNSNGGIVFAPSHYQMLDC